MFFVVVVVGYNSSHFNLFCTDVGNVIILLVFLGNPYFLLFKKFSYVAIKFFAISSYSLSQHLRHNSGIVRKFSVGLDYLHINVILIYFYLITIV